MAIGEVSVTVNIDKELKAKIQELQDQIDEMKKRTCKNCKWWDRVDKLDIGECLTVNYCHSYEDAVFKPQEDFGCNQWESKE